MHPLSGDFKRKHVETKYLEKHKVSGGGGERSSNLVPSKDLGIWIVDLKFRFPHN